MKTESLMIRISERDKNELKRQAQAHQMTMSEYVVYLIRKGERNMTDMELKKEFPDVEFETTCNTTLGRYETFAIYHEHKALIHPDMKASVTNFINAVISFENQDEHFQKVNNMDFYYWKDFYNYSIDKYLSQLITKMI